MSGDSDSLEDLLAKARRSLDVAWGLLADGHADFAASRAYYGCFYIAEALLLSEDLAYSRHTLRLWRSSAGASQRLENSILATIVC